MKEAFRTQAIDELPRIITTARNKGADAALEMFEAALVDAFNAGVERGAHWLAVAPCTQEDEDAYVASGKGGPFDFYAEQVRALKLKVTP